MKISNGFWAGLSFGVTFVISATLGAIINPLPFIFQNGTTADATQVNADLAQIVNNVNANAAPIVGSAFVPAGAAVAFNLAACPTGWIPANGASGTPDLRGYFVRGLDTSGLIDPGRVRNTIQQDQVQDHGHSVSGGTKSGSFDSGFAGGGNSVAGGSSTIVVGNPNSGNHGTETRPKNNALLYCIKS